MKTQRNTAIIGILAVLGLVFAGLSLTGCVQPEGGPSNQTPVAGDYNFGNLTQTAGSVTAVTVTAKAGKSAGTITIYYNGSTTLPTAAGTYAVTFDVAAVPGWDAATGLSAGTLTVNAAGTGDNPGNGDNQTPVAADYDFGNLSQTAGNVTAVTITAKAGKSAGTITIYYNGSTTLPTVAGTYAVTFNVAAAVGWNAAAGLSAGNLVIHPVGENLDPEATDYNIGNLSQTAGSITAVTITAKAGKSAGTITIYYNGSTTLPTVAGTYAVTFDAAAATGWNAATGLSAGNLVIHPVGENLDPEATDYTIGNLSQTAGSITAVTITAKAGKSTGAITIYYDDSTTLPSAAGTYAVTFDVAAATGWNAASGLSAGDLIITPKVITFTVNAIPVQTYTGSAIEPEVTVKDGATTLILTTDYTVEYADNTDMGTAVVTITGEGNYTGSTGSATFTINKVITFSVDAIVEQIYTGSAIEPAVTVKDGATILTLATDYTVGYADNTNAGTATITITGAGNYTGSSGEATFTINPKVITFAVDAILAQTYTGNAIEPVVTVKDGATALTLTTDYTVEYADNIIVGTAAVTITGVSNYAGSAGSADFTIDKATGAIVGAPTASSVTTNSITINDVAAPANGQTVEYAYSTENSEPAAGWQDGLIFGSLNGGTTYYVFARAQENDNYTAGAASCLTVSTRQTVSENRFEYYWVDQHGSLATTSGGAATVNKGQPLTITAQGEGYHVKQWYLNGVDTSKNGNTYTFLSAAAGTYTVGLFVEKDGKLYNTNITITVQ